MSRIANKVVSLSNVEMNENLENNIRVLKFKGPLGNMELKLHKDIVVEIDQTAKNVKVSGEAEIALKGTFVRLIENSIIGVTKGFEKKVKLNGTGYKANLEGTKLKLSIGLSHDVFLNIPEGIKVVVPNNSNIILTSCNKELLGKFTDILCKSKKYNVYNGTGILDSSKFYRRKVTKKK